MDVRQSLKIVIAGDDQLTRHALRLLLMEQGHEVVDRAPDVEPAADLCATREPDLVFHDINMPKLHGHGAAERIRVQSAGVISGFVVKPFNSAKVVTAIGQCLKQHGVPVR